MLAPAPGLTEAVAEFAANTTYKTIPTDVLHLGKKSILDGLGPALVGAKTPTCQVLQSYLGGIGLPLEGSTVIGTGMRLPPRFAALANGTATHAHDYDDTMQAATGKFQGIHPTAPVFTALAAQAERSRKGVRDGRALLAAYEIGVEVTCKLFDATAPEHILNGFHSTGTCGLLGAAAAVAAFEGAQVDRVRTTLGIAASMAAGLQENFGTMVKPFHAGRSAEGAIVAADLAHAGFTSSPIILEAPRGFFQAYGGGWERERIVGRLGRPWSFVDRGIWLKPWPTGSLGHPAVTLFLELTRKHGVDPARIARIKVCTSENIHKTLLHHRPTTELEAKFSMEFCIAAILLNRELGLQHFTDEFVESAPIQRLINLIDYETFTEPDARAAGYTIVTSLGEITMDDGTVFSSKRDYGKGSLADPMTDAEVEAKFHECARYVGWPTERTSRIVDLVWRLEQLPDISELMLQLSN
jgi:2-methylcitrate dehydratase PrpD